MLFHGNAQYIGLYFKEVYNYRGLSFAWASNENYTNSKAPNYSHQSANKMYVEHNFCGAVSNSSLIVAKIHPLPVKPVGTGYCKKSFRISTL